MLKRVIIVGAGILSALTISSCSQQQQVESKPQVQTKKVYIEKKHCHTFKGYGWNKKTCHSHPAPHRHTKKSMKPRSRYPSIRHSHNGRVHSHPMKSANHQHRQKPCPVYCRRK